MPDLGGGETLQYALHDIGLTLAESVSADEERDNLPRTSPLDHDRHFASRLATALELGRVHEKPLSRVQADARTRKPRNFVGRAVQQELAHAVVELSEPT